MLKFIWKLTKALLLLFVLLIVSIFLFMEFAPVFGGSPDELSLKKIKASVNYDGKIFKNSVPTKLETPTDTKFSIMDFLSPADGKNPKTPLPSKAFDKHTFYNGDLVWFGHSTILLKTNDLTVLTDPVFYSASPVSFLVKPFTMQIENTIERLPVIDVVLISHDHYDHLDYRSIQEMDAKVKKYLVPLGVKAHLQRWGIADEKIKEMDWYEQDNHQAIQFTFTPSRHFSGRGFTNRFSTLWGSWVIKSDDFSIFFSGDSGYYDEFKNIGDQFGPFDIAFIENGAYNPAWSQIHMFPEDSVKASIDLKAKIFFPIHWGKFDLSVHSWKDPIIRAKKAAKQNNIQIALPMIGQRFTKTVFPNAEWWGNIK